MGLRAPLVNRCRFGRVVLATKACWLAYCSTRCALPVHRTAKLITLGFHERATCARSRYSWCTNQSFQKTVKHVPGQQWQTLAFVGLEKLTRLTQSTALGYVGAELDAPKKEGENDDQFLHRPNRSTKVSVRHQLTFRAIAALIFNSTAHSRLQHRLFSFS